MRHLQRDLRDESAREGGRDRRAMSEASEPTLPESTSTIVSSELPDSTSTIVSSDGSSEHLGNKRASGSDSSLSILHACVHCRASKTACTDQRPCNRCCRLGLECTSDGSQLRKRACRSCHAQKVACSMTFGEVCGRCQRLGLKCEPRDAATGPRRKRMRPLHSQPAANTATVPAQAAQVLTQHPAAPGVHLAPIDLLQAAFMGSSPTGDEASSSRLTRSDSGAGVRGTDSPTTASSMFSVAASLLDLSRSKHAVCAGYVVPGSPARIMTSPGAFVPPLTLSPLTGR